MRVDKKVHAADPLAFADAHATPMGPPDVPRPTGGWPEWLDFSQAIPARDRPAPRGGSLGAGGAVAVRPAAARSAPGCGSADYM